MVVRKVWEGWYGVVGEEVKSHAGDYVQPCRAIPRPLKGPLDDGRDAARIVFAPGRVRGAHPFETKRVRHPERRRHRHTAKIASTTALRHIPLRAFPTPSER